MDRYQAGESLRAIAGSEPISKTAARDLLIRRGVGLRPRGQANHIGHREYERTLALRAQGWSQARIGVALGVSQPAVFYRLRRAGVA